MGACPGKRPRPERLEHRHSAGAGRAVLLSARETGVLHRDPPVLALLRGRRTGARLLGGGLAGLARDVRRLPQAFGELLHAGIACPFTERKRAVGARKKVHHAAPLARVRPASDDARLAPHAVLQVAVLGALLATSSAARAARRCPAGRGGGPTPGGDRIPSFGSTSSTNASRAPPTGREVWTWAGASGLASPTVGNLVPLLFVAPRYHIDGMFGAGTTVIASCRC